MSIKNSRVKVSWTMLALVFILLLSFFPNQQSVTGQASSWSPPIKLSNKFQSSWFPEILTDKTGTVHVFWASGIGNFDVVMYRSLTPGQKWSDANDIVALQETSGGVVTRPNGLITPDGQIYLLYRNFTLFDTVANVQHTHNASDWSKANQVSRATNVMYFSRLAMDSKGVFHLFYTENTPSSGCTICFYLYYRRSTDKGITWTDPKLISELYTGVAKPQVIIDPTDKIHIVWEAGPGGDLGSVETTSQVEYVSSSDGGTTWTDPYVFSILSPSATGTPASTKNSPSKTPTLTPTPAQDVYSKFITIGQNGNGNFVVAWLSIPEDVVYYSVSANSGATWSSPQPVPGLWGGWTIYAARTDDYSMATDSAGAVHLVLSGRTKRDQKNLSMLHLVWDGTKWSAPETIKGLEGDVPEWPRIAVGNGNQLYAVWFERDKAHIFSSESVYYSIWFSQGLADAPAVASTEYPKFSPTALPTKTPSPDVSHTPTAAAPLPTLQPAPTTSGIIGIQQPSYSETDYLILLAKTLVPTLFFLGLVIIGVVILRRR